jgi:histidinol phosphatase-like enzyme (inositol monophosphatase family)
MDFRSFLEEIAREAGKITLKYFNNPSLEIITKSDATPVTLADRETEEFLRKRIRAQFPDDIILGEEFGTDGSNPDQRWILDPIDGTKSFVHGVPLYGVLIGLEQFGEISHGVVYLPALDEIISAGTGEGCFWNGRKCHVSNVTKLEDATLLATNMRRLEQTLSPKAYSELTGNVKLTRGWGDCYGHILVATGRAEIMVDPQMAIWDCSPLGVIVEEAGGQSFDLTGKRTIDGGSLISCTNGIAREVRTILTANV